MYCEYTGTIIQEILAESNLGTEDPIRAATADSLGVSSISDLRRHSEVRFGLSNEFMDRGDGWPSLRQRYRLSDENVRGLDHDLAYRALDSGDIDVMDVYTTDAEISYLGALIGTRGTASRSSRAFGWTMSR